MRVSSVGLTESWSGHRQCFLVPLKIWELRRQIALAKAAAYTAEGRLSRIQWHNRQLYWEH